MRDGKLLQLLGTFQKGEWKSCRRYLSSEMDESAEVIYLYDYIVKYKKDLSHGKLDQEYANEFLFKNKTTKNFQNLMSRLYGYALDFIAIAHVKSDPRELELHALMSLNERGLYKRAVDAHDEYVGFINSDTLGIWNSLYSLRATHAINFSDNHIVRRDKLSYISSLFKQWREVTSELSSYYLMELKMWSKIKGQDTSAEEKTLSEYIGVSKSEHVISRISILIVETSSGVNQEAYKELYDIYIENLQRFKPSIGTMVLLALINYQQKMIQFGNDSLGILSELFQSGLETKLLLDRGKITDARFKNMIHVFCFSVDRDLAPKMLVDWQHCLWKGSRESVVKHCQATIFFYESKYDESIGILLTRSFSKGWDKNAARILLVLNYFMIYTDDIDFMISQIDNAKDYFARNKEGSSDRYRKGVFNLLSLLMRLVNKEDRKVISRDMENTSPLIRRSWLRQYLNEKRP